MSGNKSTKKIFISDCLPGMKLAENILNKYGNIFIPEGEVVDDFMLDRIRQLNVDMIKIYEENLDIITERHRLQKQYEKRVESAKEILKDIGRGKKIQVEKVRNLAEDLTRDVLEEYNFMQYLKAHSDVSDYLFTHSINVCILSMMIGKWLNFDKIKLKNLVYAGLLHDIGQAKVPAEILYKKGSLTPHEKAYLEQHTVLGYEILSNSVSMNKSVAYGVLMHHEKVDGSGYPMKLKGDKIHEFAKIISIAEAYDDLTNDKTYRTKKSPFYAMKEIEKGSFTAYDGNVSRVFLQNMSNLYIGDTAVLNNGKRGTIIYIHPQNICAPVIKIGEEFFDLKQHQDVTITELI